MGWGGEGIPSPLSSALWFFTGVPVVSNQPKARGERNFFCTEQGRGKWRMDLEGQMRLSQRTWF